MIEVIYGRQAVRETLRAGRRRLYKLFVARGVKARGIVADILALAAERGLEAQFVDRRRLDQISGRAHHQGIAAEVSPYPYADLDECLSSKKEGEVPLFLILDHLQDPQNLGCLLRTAEAVGVHGVLIPERRATGVTPAVVNASAGAAEHLAVGRVVNLVRAMERLKDAGLWIFGLEDAAGAKRYFEADLTVPLALVVGSEGTGLGRLVRERCDLLLRLPMRGQIGSLNAAVAGSIALYEVWRQRQRILERI